jgi:hypothetical protein
MLLISVSKLDDARPAGDVEADLAAGVPRERELAIYFNALMESSEAKAGAKPLPRREGYSCPTAVSLDKPSR